MNFVYLIKEEWWPVLIPDTRECADYCVPADMPELVAYLAALKDFHDKTQALHDKVLGTHSLYQANYDKGVRQFTFENGTDE